jgi:hypothetical protein
MQASRELEPARHLRFNMGSRRDFLEMIGIISATGLKPVVDAV